MKTLKFLPLHILLCFFLAGCGSQSDKAEGIGSLTDSLSQTLRHKDDFVRAREAGIAELRSRLFSDSASMARDALMMSREYSKFEIDSAISYASRAIESSTDETERLKARLFLSKIYSMGGRFLEAGSILETFDPEDVTPELKLPYYEAVTSFWDYYSISTRYKVRRPAELTDSLLKYLPRDSYLFRVDRVAKAAFADSVAGAAAFRNMLDSLSPGSPEYAMLTNYFASFLNKWGRKEEAKRYLTLSAITDLHNATRETLSLQELAGLLYEDGDFTHALEYSQSNLDDVIASGISLRSPEVVNFYSIITSAYNEREQGVKRTLIWFTVALVLALIVVAALALNTYRQMKRITAIQHQLARSNQQLTQLNERLKGANAELNANNSLLTEANNVKEEYITQFFDLCFCYISKMEQNQISLHKLAVARAYDKLTQRLKPGSGISDELEALYSRFDSVFLTLYPDFIDRMNSLLRPEERIELKEPDRLTRELRIFALLKLGITDGGKIASFLRCSTSTVYNYRTRFRNKAIDRDNFEQNLIS